MDSLRKDKLEELLDVRLMDAGDNWKCKCPFHDESTPSFFIHKDDLICHCFGCGKAGYVDFLIYMLRDIPIQDVRKILNVNPYRFGAKSRDGVHFVRVQPTLFPESWLAPWPKKIHSYIIERGFTLEVLRKAESRFDSSTRRQVFPIRDEEGNLVGATGRSVAGEDPKWLHYWNYKKGEHLYCPTIGEEPLCIVEGALDALWLAQYGWYAAAILGSRPTEQQINHIKRKANHVIIAFDNDEPGQKGAQYLYDKLKGSCVVEYAVLPAFANDVCDLTESQLKEVLTSTKNAVQVSLSVQND